jgi:cytochrome P460
MRISRRSTVAFVLALTAGCEASLPEDVEDYAARCLKMNPTEIPPYDGDPHRGFKNVYACNVDRALVQANTRPFPDGTIIVKESTRPGESAVWLVATARKQGGGWHWDEYTRNFADESLRRNLAGQSICTGCHQHAQAADWIFTQWARP